MVGILFLINNVNAAPMPWGIALNHETKQCINYWGGDEFSQNPLREGFEAYYPDFDNSGRAYFETVVGSCIVSANGSNNIDFSECCEQLGYTFVSDTNNLYKKDDSNLIIIVYVSAIIILIAVVGLIYFKKIKKK